MSFGKAFGKLIQVKRGIEGMTQQQLAVRAFGKEGSKTRISELENGHIPKPQQRIVDALVVALDISDIELNRILNGMPHPAYVDTLIDYVELNGRTKLYAEVAVHESGRAYFFHDAHFKVELIRFEFFAEEQVLVCVTSDQSRRGFGFPLRDNLAQLLTKCTDIQMAFVRSDDEWELGQKLPMKVIP